MFVVRLVQGVALVVTTSWVIGNGFFIFILRFGFNWLATSVSAGGAAWLDNAASKNLAFIISVAVDGDTTSEDGVFPVELDGLAPVVV